jgi:hypothetical protein
MGELPRRNGAELKRGEVGWADLGAYRPREQTGRRPAVIWQSDTLTRESGRNGTDLARPRPVATPGLQAMFAPSFAIASIAAWTVDTP